MSTSRAHFLQRLRAAVPSERPLPPSYAVNPEPGSVDRFVRTVEAVGGAAQRVAHPHGLGKAIDDLTTTSQRWIHPSLVPRASARLPEPEVSTIVLPGLVGVAEDAAVLVNRLDDLGPPEYRPRGMAFLAEHMVLVLPASKIVANLHAAFGLPDIQRALSESHFAVWVSGPSKTADIEQTLVLGAHGPERLTVLVVETV